MPYGPGIAISVTAKIQSSCCFYLTLPNYISTVISASGRLFRIELIQKELEAKLRKSRQYLKIQKLISGEADAPWG